MSGPSSRRAFRDRTRARARRRVVPALCLPLCLSAWLWAGAAIASAQAAQPSPGTMFDIAAPMAILTEAESGEVLWAKDADRRHPPASLSKLMQLLIVMEALDAGRVSLSDKVTASHRAATFGGSSMWVKEGEVFTVDELLKGVAVASANDASVMLAEFLSGTEERFVEAMNRRAKQLGLKNTHFVNSMGLPVPGGQGNYSSAADLAVISRELLKHPRILRYTSLRSWTIRGGRNIFTNTNHLLERYPGADGLKTGHTEEAGWCLAATAHRDGLRLIAVVLDAGSDEGRVAQSAALLDYGFNHFTRVRVMRKGDRVATFDVPRGGRPVVAVAGRDIAVVEERGKRPAVKALFTRRPGLRPPIRPGDEVGTVRLQLPNGRRTASVPVVAAHEVKRANPVVNFFLALGRWLLHLITLGRR